jgi:hypothetical protein
MGQKTLDVCAGDAFNLGVAKKFGYMGKDSGVMGGGGGREVDRLL